jgi:putative DNA primase/helicase
VVAAPQSNRSTAPPDGTALSGWVRQYCTDFQTFLTPLRPRSKEPYLIDWNTPSQCYNDPELAEAYWRLHSLDGVGLVHGPSGTAAADVDSWDHTVDALTAVGIDLSLVLSAGARSVGKASRAKGWYTTPAGLALPTVKLRWPNPTTPGRFITLLELRSGDVQDALPPTVHPDTGQPYRWLRDASPWDLGGFPDMPPLLVHLWTHWDELLPQLEAACPWPTPEATRKRATNGTPRQNTNLGEWDDLRETIRQRCSVEAMLATMGVTARGGKYLCPFHEESHPSFWTFPAEENYDLWACAHGSAQVGLQTAKGYSVGDVIDLHAHRRGITTGAATVELAHDLGLRLPGSGPTWNLGSSPRTSTDSGTGEPVNPDSATRSPDPYHCSDLGNANRLRAEYGADFRWCDAGKCWYIWTGRRWEIDRWRQVYRWASEIPAVIAREASDASDKTSRQELLKHALRSEGEARIRAMVELAKSLPGIPITPEQLDADVYLLNVANGSIGLRTGGLQPHRREDYCTKLAPVEYNPGAACELWDAFLQRVLPDTELRAFTQRGIGYSLTGATIEEVLFFAFGPTATGKSTLLAAVCAALGDYAATADFDTFLVQNRAGGTARSDIARLAGRRFVVSLEVDDGAKLASALVKQLTGGDTVAARFLYREAFEFLPTAKLWLAANARPRVADDDDAIWRRILQLPFDQQIPVDERDPQVKARLRDPADAGPAILAWAVAGCLAWQREGLGVPSAVRETTAAYRQEMDPLHDFLDDCCVIHPDAWASSGALWTAYQDWAKESGVKYPLRRKVFGERLHARGCAQEKQYQGSSATRGWRGIGLANDLSQPFPDTTDRSDSTSSNSEAQQEFNTDFSEVVSDASYASGDGAELWEDQ